MHNKRISKEATDEMMKVFPFPSSPSIFYGRDRHIKWLKEKKYGFYYIGGMQGSGKTALCAFSLRHEKARWMDIYPGFGLRDLIKKAELFLDKVHINFRDEEKSLEDQARIFLSLINQEGLTLIMDDFHHISPEESKIIAKLANKILKKSRIFVLTREIQHSPPADSILLLEPLDNKEIVGMIKDFSKVHELKVNDSIIDGICDFSGGNPLLVKLALGHIIGTGELPDYDQDEIRGIIDNLPPKIRYVLALLGACDMPIPLEALDLYQDEIMKLKSRLLIEAGEKLSLHPAIKNRIEQDPTIIEKATQLLEELGEEYHHQAFLNYCKLDDRESAKRLLSQYYLEWFRQGLGIFISDAIKKWPDDPFFGAIRLMAYDILGKYKKAGDIIDIFLGDPDFMEIAGIYLPSVLGKNGLYERAEALARKLLKKGGLSRENRAELSLDYASILSDQGKTKRAINQCKELLSDEGLSSFILGRALHFIAVQYYNLGDLDNAIKYAEPAMEKSLEWGDILGIPRLRGTMAMIAARRGNFTKARELLEKNLEDMEKIADKRGMIIALNTLSTVLGALRQPSLAREILKKAFDLAQDEPWAKAECLNFSGNLEYREAFWPSAINAWNEAIEHYGKMGRKRNVAMIWPKLISAYLLMGDLEKAEDGLKIAWDLTEEFQLEPARGRLSLFKACIAFSKISENPINWEKWAENIKSAGDLESAGGISFLGFFKGDKGSVWKDYLKKNPAGARELMGFILRFLLPFEMLFIADKGGLKRVKEEEMEIIMGKFQKEYELWLDLINGHFYSGEYKKTRLFSRKKELALLCFLAKNSEPVNFRQIHGFISKDKYDPFTHPYSIRTLVNRLRNTLSEMGLEGLVATGLEEGYYLLDFNANEMVKKLGVFSFDG